MKKHFETTQFKPLLFAKVKLLSVICSAPPQSAMKVDSVLGDSLTCSDNGAMPKTL